MEPFDSIVDRLVLNRGEPPKAEGPGLSGYAIAPASAKAKAKVDHADRTEPRQDTIHRIVSHQVLSDRSSPQQVRGPNSDTRQLDLRAGLAAVDVAVVASGGVTTVDDVVRLAAIPMAGCIIGPNPMDRQRRR